MKTAVVVNPKAAGGRVEKQWSQLRRTLEEALGSCEFCLTESVGSATALTRRLLEGGFERIVVVGGDGSANEVLNGFFDPTTGKLINSKACFGLYPFGTGGDLARSLGLRSSRGVVWEHLTIRAVDVGCTTFRSPKGEEGRRFFLNAASFGASGLIVDRVNQTTKALGGRASFWLGTMRGLWAYRNRRVRLRIDDQFEEDVLVNTVVVANARYFGGGMKIAPQATITDGLLDVIIIGDISAATFLRHSGRLYAGRHLELPHIRLLRGKQISATLLEREPVWVEVDGELAGLLDAQVTVLPGVLPLWAPWQASEMAS